MYNHEEQLEKMKTGILKNIAMLAKNGDQQYEEFSMVDIGEHETFSQYASRLSAEGRELFLKDFGEMVFRKSGSDHSLSDIDRLEKVTESMMSQAISTLRERQGLPRVEAPVNEQW